MALTKPVDTLKKLRGDFLATLADPEPPRSGLLDLLPRKVTKEGIVQATRLPVLVMCSHMSMSWQGRVRQTPTELST